MEYEYTRFGPGWLRRAAESTDDWEPCADADVPAWRAADEDRAKNRRAEVALGVHPDPGYSAGATILHNPKVEAIAERLGLSGQELRERLNNAPGGTRKRVDDAEFDAAMAELGIDPAKARARFRDESTAKADDDADAENAVTVAESETDAEFLDRVSSRLANEGRLPG
ncbi:MAG: hypothetical protein AB7I04_18435 [Pseudomonadales bacterium]